MASDDDSDDNFVERDIKRQTRREKELMDMYASRLSSSNNYGSTDVQPAGTTTTRSHRQVSTPPPPVKLPRPHKLQTSANLGIDLTLHPISQGEAIVYRDMAELTRREIELRQHWKSMGLSVPAVARWNEELEVYDTSGNDVPTRTARINSLCEEVVEYDSVDNSGRSSCSSSLTELEQFTNRRTYDAGLHETDNAIYDVTWKSGAFRQYPLNSHDAVSGRRLNDGETGQPSDELSKKQPEIGIRFATTTTTTSSNSGQTRSAFISLTNGTGASRMSLEEAQQRILNELNEVKRREAELREQREYRIRRSKDDQQTTVTTDLSAE